MLWILGFFLFLYVGMRLFGRQLAALGMRRLVRMVQKDMERGHVEYEQNYDPGAFRSNVYADKEIKVTAPNEGAKKHVSEDDIAQDVNFEELK